VKLKLLVVGMIGALLSVGGSIGLAAALSVERDTPQRLNAYVSLTVKTNVIIYAGSLVCVDASGYANPAADSSGFAVVGRAEATADNRGVNYSSTKTIKIAKGTFRWANADSIAVSNIGAIVYVTDDQTVNKTGGGQNIIAGTVVDVDSSGVWVDTAKVGPIGAATPSSLAVSGGATVGTTLAVTGATALNGGLTMDTSKFTVADTSGNTAIGGTLQVLGTSSFTGAVTAVSTVAASGFKIGAITGYSGAITNISTISTNIMQYSGGVLTNSINVP
jgi:hypothetical protein